jgi:hypothetical protein
MPGAEDRLKSPYYPPFSKGELLMLKTESIIVHRKYSRVPLFESEFPSLEKRGQGRFLAE